MQIILLQAQEPWTSYLDYASQRMSRPFIFLCEKLLIPETKILKDSEMPRKQAFRSCITLLELFSFFGAGI